MQIKTLDPLTQPREFLHYLYDVVVERALPLHNTQGLTQDY